VRTSFSKQLAISDLVPRLSLPIVESVGEHAQFSCVKNSSSHVLHDRYKLEKSELSLFKKDNWCFVLDFFCTGGLLKRAKLFLFTGLVDKAFHDIHTCHTVLVQSP